ncbi:MAG: hypothetical protein JST32_18080 [Bacteroidetes bacterium]|nr:hypothetical protein [Bacteroidota bacterium]
MLRIEVSPDGPSHLTFSELEKYNIPAPGDGFDSEINGRVVLQFEDEQEAIDYSNRLDKYAESLSGQNLPEYLIVRDIIHAISDDEFVQAYIQS